MVPTFRSGHFSIQVWAAIAYNLKTPLVVLPLAPRKKRLGSGNQWDPAENLTAVRYRNWIIDGPLRDAVTAVSAYPDGLLVVRDGSRCHQATICKQRRAEYNIKTREHPPASPDLNPIENICLTLMRDQSSKQMEAIVLVLLYESLLSVTAQVDMTHVSWGRSNCGSGQGRVPTELSEIGRIEGSMTELVRISRNKALLQMGATPISDEVALALLDPGAGEAVLDVIGLNTQVAWRLLVHRGGAQAPRLGSQKKTTIAGLGMVEQEARGLAGTGNRHGRSATSMETMDMEDLACMQGGPSTATRRTELKEHTDGYHSGARETRVKGTITGQREGAVYRKPASRS
ncbi:uncharacterized protein UHOD_11422 [Ustilago sp. UG-2017b]|nr:uncharacterized protein UHOD_11422 [Ustilago sp. UG-2017b]